MLPDIDGQPPHVALRTSDVTPTTDQPRSNQRSDARIIDRHATVAHESDATGYCGPSLTHHLVGVDRTILGIPDVTVSIDQSRDDEARTLPASVPLGAYPPNNPIGDGPRTLHPLRANRRIIGPQAHAADEHTIRAAQAFA